MILTGTKATGPKAYPGQSAGDHQLSHILHLADYYTVQAGVAVAGRTDRRELDAYKQAMVPLDPDALRTIAENSRQYVQSLTGRMRG